MKEIKKNRLKLLIEKHGQFKHVFTSDSKNVNNDLVLDDILAYYEAKEKGDDTIKTRFKV